MTSEIKPRYFDENGVTYFRLHRAFQDKLTLRLYYHDIKKSNLKDYHGFEVYGNNGKPEESFLCYVLSSFHYNGTVDKCYIIYNNEENINIIKNNSNILHIYDNFGSVSKVFYINLNSYVSKLVKDFKFIENIFIVPWKATINYYIRSNLNNYILKIHKPFHIYKKYLKKFNSIPENLKKDLEEVSNLIIDLTTMDKSRLNDILLSVLKVPDYNNTGKELSLPLNKFNNVKIIYNNYDERRIVDYKDVDLFDSLQEYNSILCKLCLEEPKYIQLRGMKFCIKDKITIDDGFRKYNISNNGVPDPIKKYILTTCDISSVKSEIEKILLTN